MLATAAIAALAATRWQPASTRSAAQPSRIAAVLSGVGLGPVSATGIRLALTAKLPA